MRKSVYFENSLDFMVEYQRKIKEIVDEIECELPNMGTRRSHSLERLANKIHHMIIYRYNGPSMREFIEAIVFRGSKAQSKPSWRRGGEGEFLGRGHFRWDEEAVMLTKEEVDRVAEYFQIQHEIPLS